MAVARVAQDVCDAGVAVGSLAYVVAFVVRVVGGVSWAAVGGGNWGMGELTQTHVL